MKLLESINSTVSAINARKREEESREAARRWRLQQEEEINAAFDDSIASAISRLGTPARHSYRVSGSRPKFHDPNVPWMNSMQSPAEIKLLTDRQPSPEEIKRWMKNELMRYFVILIRESTVFDRCKTLSDAAKEFTSRLENGVLPMQLAMLSKHKRGDLVTHPEDWIISFDRSYEGRAVYLNRGKDAFENWWKGTKFDPNRRRPWRHEHQYRK
ncbi:hypothetical protein OROHE_007366 [Orobanche hederae]